MDGWNTIVSFWGKRPIFRGYLVGFGGCIRESSTPRKVNLERDLWVLLMSGVYSMLFNSVVNDENDLTSRVMGMPGQFSGPTKTKMRKPELEGNVYGRSLQEVTLFFLLEAKEVQEARWFQAEKGSHNWANLKGPLLGDETWWNYTQKATFLGWIQQLYKCSSSLWAICAQWSNSCIAWVDDTVDGSEIPNNHLGCIKPWK